MAYLAGAMELTTPSKDHERIKSHLGRLIEAYALERGLDLSPYGAWTLKSATSEAGAEPDECYLVGPDQGRDTPDLAIGIIWTSGGLDKLEIYRRLKVGEVWFWRDGQVAIHVLQEGRYEQVDRSRLFPDLDPGLVCSLLEQPTALQAIRALRAHLQR